MPTQRLSLASTSLAAVLGTKNGTEDNLVSGSTAVTRVAVQSNSFCAGLCSTATTLQHVMKCPELETTV